MNFITRALVILGICSICFSSQPAQAETILIGNGYVVCEHTVEDGFAYGQMYRVVDTVWKRIKRRWQFRKFMRKTRKQIRRAENNGEDTTILNLILSDLQTGKSQFKSCRNGELGSDDGSGDGDGGSGDGGSGDGGSGDGGSGSGGTEAACSAFESSAISSVLVPRIINGSKCNNASSTAVVEVYLDGSAGCTGSYVGDYNGNSVVFFAAHCLDGVSSVSIVTGGGTQFNVSSFHSHPNWNQGASTEVNDMAIAVVSGSMSGTIPSIPSCTSGVVSGVKAYAAGYGYVNGQNQTTDGLHAGTLTIDNVTTTSIYAQYTPPENEVTSCNGDSGGPIMVEIGGSKCIAGAVSWGSNQTCGSDGTNDDAWWTNFTDPNNRSFIDSTLPGFL